VRFVVPDGLTARPRTAADTEFLAALYASTRATELAPVPWPDDAKRAFLRQQFDAQTKHYDQHYADAEFLVLERDGEPVGRLILFWGADDLRIVDISLVPACCGHGLGTALLGAAMAQAPGSVSIHVERFNPALRLYQRLGFVHEEDTGVYFRMRWQPEPARASSTGTGS
jgi:RimJ/RimL family protein N-acetyltransferase